MAQRVHHVFGNGVLSLTWLGIRADACPRLCMLDAGMHSYSVVSAERWPQLYRADDSVILEMRYHDRNGIMAGVVVGIAGVSGCLWFGTHAPSRLPASVRAHCRNAEHSPFTKSPSAWCEYIDLTSRCIMLLET